MTVRKSNGILVRWVSVSVVFVLAVIAAVVWLTTVQQTAQANTTKIEEVKKTQANMVETLNRIDRRQAIIMHKLGAKDEHP